MSNRTYIIRWFKFLFAIDMEVRMTTLSHCHKGNSDSRLHSSRTMYSYDNNIEF